MIALSQKPNATKGMPLLTATHSSCCSVGGATAAAASAAAAAAAAASAAAAAAAAAPFAPSPPPRVAVSSFCGPSSAGSGGSMATLDEVGRQVGWVGDWWSATGD